MHARKSLSGFTIAAVLGFGAVAGFLSGAASCRSRPARRWYLARQLKYFKAGLRGATEENPEGTHMRGMAELNSQSLVGQSGDYLIRQLEHFSSGLRGTREGDIFGMQMRPIVLSTLMSRQDIVDIVAHITSLPAAKQREAQEGR